MQLGGKMDFKLFLTTFLAVFLAEMGDKTQLVAMAVASRSHSPWLVWSAVALALVIASALGVLVGSLVGGWLSRDVVKYFSAVLFITVGVWMLLAK